MISKTRLYFTFAPNRSQRLQMRFERKVVRKKVGVAAAAVTMLTTGFAVLAPASPAAADTCTNWYKHYSYDNFQTEIDNCPGTGDSWAWIYDPTGGANNGWAQVWVQFYDNSTAVCAANQPDGDGTLSGSCDWSSQDVWRFQIQTANNTGYYYSPVQYM